MKYHYEVKNNQVRNLLTNLKKTNKQKTFLHFKDYQQKASDFLDSLYRHNNPVCLRSLFSFFFLMNVISIWRTKLHFLFGVSVVLTTVAFYYIFLTMLHLHHYKWRVSLWAPQTVCAVKLMLVKMCDFSRETCSGSQHGENVDAVSQRHERRWCGEFVHRLKRWTTHTWPFIRQAEILF